LSPCWRIIDLTDIDWVIVGGESGHGARPMQREWVLNIRHQCLAAKVPFFFKQWGGVRKSRSGRELDGKTYDEIPRIAERHVPPLSGRSSLAAGLCGVQGSKTSTISRPPLAAHVV
jgi:hypothetical protein